MGNDEEYELGVKNGQRGGFLDDFCQPLTDTGSSYDKGYVYGVDHRYDSRGERFHTWGNDGKNDSKPGKSSSSSWFGFGSDNSKSSDESSESETNTDSSTISLSSYDGYSGVCGGRVGSVSVSDGSSGLLKIIGGGILCLGLGLGIFNSTGNNKPQNNQLTSQQKIEREFKNRKYNDRDLEENVKRLSQFLQQNNQLIGNFNDYEVIIPPKRISKPPTFNEYEIGFIKEGTFYVFHSYDRGKTWGARPPSDPFLIKLARDHVNEISKNGKLSDNWLEEIRKRGRIEDVERSLNSLKIEDIDVKTKLPDSRWDTSDLKPSKNAKAKLQWWLEDELRSNLKSRKTLENLAEAVYKQTNGFDITIYDYSQKNKKLWVAGGYSGSDSEGTQSEGFIYHSFDNGESWDRQWLSRHHDTQPVYGIHFSDEEEGYALTLKKILYTNDGGLYWREIFDDEDCMNNLFIMAKDRLIATNNFPFHFYYSKDSGQNWTKTKLTPEYEVKLEELKKSFPRGVRYGGIYSREDANE